MIYFDNSATSLIKPKSVIEDTIFAMKNLTANPGRGGHNLSQIVGQKIFDTREKIKEYLSAPNHEVIFTKNCSEALNLAIFGFLHSGDHVITTMYEHNSVLRPLEALKSRGVDVEIIDCELEDFSSKFLSHIKDNTKLVITTYVSNVTGSICDVELVGRLCKEHNITYLVDGAQACGHVDIDLQKSNIDMFTFSGHKGFVSLTGVGALVVNRNIKLEPLLYGGTGTESINLFQPRDYPEGFESGTIPSLPIISLNSGIDFISKNFKKIQKCEQNLIKYLNFKVKNKNFIKIYSNINSKNIFLFNIKGLDSSLVANELNDLGICVRAGLHCAPKAHERLGTLDGGAVRVSLDYNNTFQEIDEFIRALDIIYIKYLERIYK